MNFIYLLSALGALTHFPSYSSATMTMREELLKAQNELNIAFEFNELHMIQFTNLWMNNLTILSQDHFLPGFLKARSTLLDIIEETSSFISSYNPSACRDRIEHLWNRQSTIIGTRLQYCMRITKRIVGDEIGDVNKHIPNAQRLVAHTPNQSLNILSQNSILEPSGHIYRLINNRLRDLLSRAAPWILIMDELIDLFFHHIHTAEIMVQRCHDSIVAGFRQEAANHRNMIEHC